MIRTSTTCVDAHSRAVWLQDALRASLMEAEEATFCPQLGDTRGVLPLPRSAVKPALQRAAPRSGRRTHTVPARSCTVSTPRGRTYAAAPCRTPCAHKQPGDAHHGRTTCICNPRLAQACMWTSACADLCPCLYLQKYLTSPKQAAQRQAEP